MLRPQITKNKDGKRKTIKLSRPSVLIPKNASNTASDKHSAADLEDSFILFHEGAGSILRNSRRRKSHEIFLDTIENDFEAVFREMKEQCASKNETEFLSTLEKLLVDDVGYCRQLKLALEEYQSELLIAYRALKCNELNDHGYPPDKKCSHMKVAKKCTGVSPKRIKLFSKREVEMVFANLQEIYDWEMRILSDVHSCLPDTQSPDRAVIDVEDLVIQVTSVFFKNEYQISIPRYYMYNFLHSLSTKMLSALQAKAEDLSLPHINLSGFDSLRDILLLPTSKINEMHASFKRSVGLSRRFMQSRISIAQESKLEKIMETFHELTALLAEAVKEVERYQMYWNNHDVLRELYHELGEHEILKPVNIDMSKLDPEVVMARKFLGNQRRFIDKFEVQVMDKNEQNSAPTQYWLYLFSDILILASRQQRETKGLKSPKSRKNMLLSRGSRLSMASSAASVSSNNSRRTSGVMFRKFTKTLRERTVSAMDALKVDFTKLGEDSGPARSLPPMHVAFIFDLENSHVKDTRVPPTGFDFSFTLWHIYKNAIIDDEASVVSSAGDSLVTTNVPARRSQNLKEVDVAERKKKTAIQRQGLEFVFEVDKDAADLKATLTEAIEARVSALGFGKPRVKTTGRAGIRKRWGRNKRGRSTMLSKGSHNSARVSQAIRVNSIKSSYDDFKIERHQT